MNAAQGERIATIEAILKRMEPKLDQIGRDLDGDIREMAALKNKGSGILIGVAIAAGGIGAGFGTFWKWIVELFT